ncbi:MAG: hypothetical protein PUB18_04570 [bacterium]|nr:hypothetical protein [bacterium]
MGLLDKLKNTFFEEEYIEVEEEQPKKKEKPIAKKVDFKSKDVEKKVAEVEKVKVVDEPLSSSTSVEIHSDKELLKTDLPYFEDEDFIQEVIEVPKSKSKSKPNSKPKSSFPSRLQSTETVKLYGEDASTLYKNLDYQVDSSHEPYSSTAKTFKPTPVISPIYGILDKNYRKEEVVDKKDKPSTYVSRRNVDLDFVRNKAFGSLEEDIMVDKDSSFTLDEPPIVKQEDSGLLYDMTDSHEPLAVEKVTIADAEEYFEDLGLEYNVDYKDSNYEKATGRRSQKEKSGELASDLYDENVNMNTSDDENLEDNLFDLIDSMYEEKE